MPFTYILVTVLSLEEIERAIPYSLFSEKQFFYEKVQTLKMQRGGGEAMGKGKREYEEEMQRCD